MPRGEVAPHRRAITGRDHVIAMLAAAAVYSWGEIAAATGTRAQDIEAKAQNVNFQALVQEYRRRFEPLDRDELDVARENTDDARNTLKFLRDVRDGKYDETPHPKLSIRVAAARTLFGSQVAPRPAPPVERPLLPPLDTKRKLMLERILQQDMEGTP